jgi:hypothetical protein
LSLISSQRIPRSHFWPLQCTLRIARLGHGNPLAYDVLLTKHQFELEGLGERKGIPAEVLSGGLPDGVNLRGGQPDLARRGLLEAQLVHGDAQALAFLLLEHEEAEAEHCSQRGHEGVSHGNLPILRPFVVPNLERARPHTRQRELTLVLA